MAINSSPPVAGAAVVQKGGPVNDPRSKLPAYGGGTPVYPPDRLPPQSRGGTPPQFNPAASAPVTGTAAAPASAVPPAAAAVPASPSADPAAELPANPPFSLTQRPAVAAATAKPAPTPAVRARPKAATPAQPPAAPAPPAQPTLLMAPAAPEPAPAPAPADSPAAAAAAEVSPGSPPAIAPFAADPPPGVASRPAARGAPFQATRSPGEDAPGGNAVTAVPTAPAGLPVSDLRHATAPKLAITSNAQTDEATPDGAATVSGPNDNPPDLTLAGLDFSAAHALAAPAATAPPPVQNPVGASGWTEEVGTHVIWMAHQGIASASLRLQPEHLGPLEVRISLHDSTASVWFGANEPETRTALQAALPQLKEMFAAQGMTLSDAGVSREPPRDTQLPRAATHGAAAPAATVLDSPPALPGARRGLVDTYA